MGSRHCLGAELLLHFEEFEALKLSDYDRLTHEQAAAKMDVSRPTFTRIYESARRKVATAFVENRPLMVEGGQVQFRDDWYRCPECRNTFAPVDKQKEAMRHCPLCEHPDPQRMSPEL
jgi:predicted DNA-binding protein (UPF0251 family)